MPGVALCGARPPEDGADACARALRNSDILAQTVRIPGVHPMWGWLLAHY
jgi:hypothetical protein